MKNKKEFVSVTEERIITVKFLERKKEVKITSLKENKVISIPKKCNLKKFFKIF